MQLARAVLIFFTLLITFAGCNSAPEPKTTEQLPKLDPPVTNAIGMRFQRIPAGEFSMGSEEKTNEQPVRKVQITEDFYLGVTEVTQGQWVRVMETTPWKSQKNVKEGANFPATYVTWSDAVKFCQRLSEMDEDASYRLPTEAEWEYACRAGTTTNYVSGDRSGKLKDFAWYRDNVLDANLHHPQEVGTRQPNAWQLYDMHGNVNEWCHDWYNSYFGAETVDPGKEATQSPNVDEEAKPQKALRVFRGGGWYYNKDNCRSAFRDGDSTGSSHDHLGLRVVRIPETAPASSAEPTK